MSVCLSALRELAGSEEKRSPSPSPCGISDQPEKIADFIPQGKIPLPPAGGERSSLTHGFKQTSLQVLRKESVI